MSVKKITEYAMKRLGVVSRLAPAEPVYTTGMAAYGLHLDDITCNDYRHPLFKEALRRYHKHNDRRLRMALAGDMSLKRTEVPEEMRDPQTPENSNPELLNIYNAVVQEYADYLHYKRS
eukprot:TRINITY_DN1881_c0_g1_i2.p2 TRINITY_DN1881_c0_g1~~TRINITY_DN1881_c0_g1_i2.p2  ORF type:complete len:119 (-),score=27.62 TRINITY_DN1881_c0_g1_i2:70-426(-)